MQANSENRFVRLPEEKSPANLLAEALGHEALREYELRTSALSNKMRKSDVAFNEDSFRRAYKVLKDLQIGYSVQEVIEARKKMNEIVGSAQSVALWAALDPSFSVLKRVASNYSVPEDVTLAAYEVILNSNEALALAAEERQTSPDHALYLMQQIVAERDSELTSILGEKAAHAFINTLGRSQNQSLAGNRR